MAFWQNLSLQQLLKGALSTFMRYPFVLLSAFVGTWAAIQRVDVPYERWQEFVYLEKLVMTAALGLILFFTLELIARRYSFQLPKRALLWALGLVLLVTYYLLLPAEVQGKQQVRFFLLALALHLAASYAMFLNRREENAFWQFNKSLFLRILTAALYSAVLYIGLALAMLAIDNLFEVKVDHTFYSKLWLALAGVFNTWFFLAGVPESVEELEQTHTYPKGLKVFTQFVLLPLVTLYLLILYFYFGKIVLEWEWPQGWVSVLVLCFSVAGILSLLLIHPIRFEEGNTWMRTFARWFYRALFPLIVLLMLAIWRRVSEYGITEPRYFVLVLALWLFCTALYFLFSRQKNIKFIPVTLSLVALLAAYGPLNAFQVAERSQLGRLRTILEREHLLVNGKVISAKSDVNDKVEQEVGSILRYLEHAHGLESIKPWFAVNLDSALAERQDLLRRQRIYDRNYTAVVMDLMGLEYERQDYMGGNLIYFNTAQAQPEEVWDVSGYDFLIDFHYGAEKGDKTEAVKPVSYKVGGDSLRVLYLPEAEALRFAYAGDTALFPLQPLYKDLGKEGSNELPPATMTRTLQGQTFALKLEMRHLALRNRGRTHVLDNVTGKLFLKRGK